MSPEERDDKLLQEYLAGDSALSRLYRDRATEQPDAHLDATIRARAHAAVARDARVAHSPFARNWMVPTSLAAVLVLSVSVVVLMLSLSMHQSAKNLAPPKAFLMQPSGMRCPPRRPTSNNNLPRAARRHPPKPPSATRWLPTKAAQPTAAGPPDMRRTRRNPRTRTRKCRRRSARSRLRGSRVSALMKPSPRWRRPRLWSPRARQQRSLVQYRPRRCEMTLERGCGLSKRCWTNRIQRGQKAIFVPSAASTRISPCPPVWCHWPPRSAQSGPENAASRHRVTLGHRKIGPLRTRKRRRTSVRYAAVRATLTRIDR